MAEEERANGYDFHCHIDLYRDPARMIAACENQRIVTLAVTTTPRAWPQNRVWARGSRFVHVAAGLHPELVADRHRETPLLVEAIREWPLVGEIGLDGSPAHRTSLARQQAVFRQALDAAEEAGGRVLSIHSRGAARQVVEMLGERTSAARVLPILHWFSGSVTEAQLASARGCFFSVNANMLKSDRGRAIVQTVPVDRLLTETDGPLTSEGGRPREPTDAVETLRALAGVLGISHEMLAKAVARNARHVLGFAGLERAPAPCRGDIP